jgi:NAD(P)-dependent dehydrogenase (short-subunit alcohol dehydrogenase family)
MNLGLDGKVALVTGAARDVGKEIALALAAEGTNVAVNFNSSKSEAAAVVDEIVAGGGKARAYQADVGDHASVQAMVGAIVKDLGGIDILVNNAGLVMPKRFLETKPEDWKRQIDVGLYGVIHCCHTVAPHMIEKKGGRIINITGDSARVGEKYLSVTSSSRGGVLSLTKSLAREFGPAGITVNAIAFGLIETSHTDKKWLEKNRERIVRQYPLGRIGRADDIAPMVAFMASTGARWITGQIQSINGGYSMVG